MEFGSNKEEDLHHRHQHNNNNNQAAGKDKLQFHFSRSTHNSSSSSSPSSFNNLWHQQTGCWLGNQDDHKKDEAAMVVEEERRSGSVVSMAVEKEHMFDKVVTPSDVGKLNRLVIPKQHAEKYFPLDSSANEKGLLLNFEDRNGKPWRFRYSYWNSSQSYVMTKGWSRFVKDKKLDAGDIVSFQRGVGELGKDRLYIDWRRRPDAPEPLPFPLHHQHLSFHRSIPWSPLLLRPPPPSSVPPMSRDHLHLSQMNHFLNRNGFYGGSDSSSGGGMGPVYYLRSQPLQLGEWQHHYHQQYQRQQHYQHNHHQHQQVVLQQEENTMVFDSVPVVQGKAAAKRLRLFGVNMDCPISDTTTTTSTTDDDDNEIDMVLSSTTALHPSLPTIQQPHQQVSSSQAPAASHQLRLYNGTAIDFLNKGKASMSFD